MVCQMRIYKDPTNYKRIVFGIAVRELAIQHGNSNFAVIYF